MARLVSHLGREASRVVEEAEGINLTQMTTLGTLRWAGPRRMTDLAGLLHVTGPAVTKIVAMLEVPGAVCRVADPDDARATLVELTDTGRELLERAETSFEGYMRSALWDHLSRDDAEMLAEVLGRLQVRNGIEPDPMLPPRD